MACFVRQNKCTPNAYKYLYMLYKHAVFRTFLYWKKVYDYYTQQNLSEKRTQATYRPRVRVKVCREQQPCRGPVGVEHDQDRTADRQTDRPNEKVLAHLCINVLIIVLINLLYYSIYLLFYLTLLFPLFCMAVKFSVQIIYLYIYYIYFKFIHRFNVHIIYS